MALKAFGLPLLHHVIKNFLLSVLCNAPVVLLLYAIINFLVVQKYYKYFTEI